MSRRPVLKGTLFLLAMAMPAFVIGQDWAPVIGDISEEHRALFQYALATLPAHSATRPDSSLRSLVARSLYALDRVPREGFFDFDVRTLTSTLRSPSAPIEATLLAGDWDCRRILVGAGGINVSAYAPCTIRRNAHCLELESPSPSHTLTGCLQALDARHMSVSSGVLSAANTLNLRIVEPHGNGIAVHDLLRKRP